MCSTNIGTPAAKSYSPMAFSICCTWDTCAICRRRAKKATCSWSAINSDASTRKLKGAGRPILAERARASLVAALAAVNYVVIFDELDVNALLREIQPDVHAKGTDYTAETVPERELAALLGIRIAIVGDPKNHSTRELLARLRGRTMSESRFLLVRLGSMGDIVHALPAASALRDTFPTARIDWVVDSKWARLLEGNPDLNNVISLDRKSAGGISAAVRQLRSAKYTHAIDFQALYKSALLAFASGAPRRIGFQSSYAREGFASVLYTDRLNPRGPHKVDHNLTLAERAGARNRESAISARDSSGGRGERLLTNLLPDGLPGIFSC